MRKLVFAAICAGLAMVQPAFAQSYNVTIAGASPGGLWSLLGAGIDAALKAEFPGSTATYQTSGGGFANAVLIDQNKVELGIVHDAELLLAKQGAEPFKAPVTSLRAISYLYTWAPMQVLVNRSFAEEHGITAFTDLATKQIPARVVLNKRGNIASNVGAEMLAAIGAPPEKIEEWGGQVIYAASSEQSDLMRDRRVDVLINSIFVRHRSIMEIAQAIPVNLLPLSEETIRVVGEKTGTSPYVIEGGSYDFAPEDTPTLTLGAALVTNESMSEEDAYNLTKALFDNHDKLAGVHKAMNQLTPEIMAAQKVVPYHAGAVKYLKEAGLQ